MDKWKSRVAFVSIAGIVSAASVAFGWISMVDMVQRANVKDSDPALGAPVEWQLNFQYPFSPLAGDLFQFHNYLLGINIAICALVLTLLLFAVWRFRRSRSPMPSRITHNTVLEVTWTIVPVLVLVAIAEPSFRLLARANNVPANAEMTLKVMGHQWFWEYTYPDQGNIEFSSFVQSDENLPVDQKSLRLLMTDQLVVLPVDTVIRIQVTSADVIHSWAMPSLGVKKDAVPGRLNEAWLKIDHEGMFFGQCSVLCGTNHAFMPIAIQAVSKQRFAQWTEEAKRKFAANQGRSNQLASIVNSNN
jgi:cytochrome c oxidase subunit II